jgi:hypothetical protein
MQKYKETASLNSKIMNNDFSALNPMGNGIRKWIKRE